MTAFSSRNSPLIIARNVYHIRIVIHRIHTTKENSPRKGETKSHFHLILARTRRRVDTPPRVDLRAHATVDARPTMRFLARCFPFVTASPSSPSGWDAFAEDVFVNDAVDDSCAKRLSRPGVLRARARKRMAIGEVDALDADVDGPTANEEARTPAAERAMLSAMDGNLLFAELDAKTKTRVMNAMVPRRVDAGEVIIRQGDMNAELFYIIESGEARVMKSEQGKRASLTHANDSANELDAPDTHQTPAYDESSAKCVATLGPGRGFGELALLYACARSATVVADTPMKMWTLHVHAFKTIKRSIAKREASSTLDLMGRVELFSALSEHQLVSICNASRRETYEAGDVVFNQGDSGDCFYIVHEGAASVRVNGVEVAKLSSGDYFGERALIHNEPRAASIVASTDLACLVLTRDTFISMLGSIEEARCFAGLAECPILAPLSDTQLTEIAESMKMQIYTGGDVVFKEGSPGDAFYVIIDGEFDVSKSNSATPIARLGRGQYFGELALLRKDKRSATITCASARGKIASMSKSAFEKKIGPLEVLQLAWRRNTLRQVPILSKLSNSEIQTLADELTDVAFTKDDVIVRQGERGDAMFILESGEVEVVDENKRDDDGQPKVLCKLGPSSYFGELSLLNADLRAATVRVPNRATVLIITKRAFESHMGNLKDILKRNAQEMYTMNGADPRKKPVAATLKQLKTVGFLGVGSFGKVTLVEHAGETFALKEIGKAQIVKRGLVEHVWREKETMSQCDSPFLVNLRRTYVSEKSIYMLMDKVLGGELFTYLQQRAAPLPESHAKFYAACVVLAFEYLHDRQIVYRDLKPENLLIGTNGYLKVTDFSFAKKLPKGTKTYTLCGTPQYLAPEQVQQLGHNRAVDWWALGVLIYELVNGTPPFNQPDDYQMYKAINEVKFHFSSRNAVQFRSVVLGLLRRLPAARLGMGKAGAKEIKRQEWFNEINWNALAQTRARAPYVPPIEDARDLRHFVDTGDEVPGCSKRWGPYVSVGRFDGF